MHQTKIDWESPILTIRDIVEETKEGFDFPTLDALNGFS